MRNGLAGYCIAPLVSNNNNDNNNNNNLATSFTGKRELKFSDSSIGRYRIPFRRIFSIMFIICSTPDSAYYVTAYFVEPSTVCTTGRTQAEFDEQGTGYLLAFQNGPTAESLHYAPLTKEEADQEVILKQKQISRLDCDTK